MHAGIGDIMVNYRFYKAMHNTNYINENKRIMAEQAEECIMRNLAIGTVELEVKWKLECLYRPTQLQLLFVYCSALLVFVCGWLSLNG